VALGFMRSARCDDGELRRLLDIDLPDDYLERGG
jgi:hypothetical protein